MAERLSRELWEMITKHLPLSDKCAPSLSCYRLQRMLPHDLLNALKLPTERIERHKFLFRMWQYYPNHYLCEACIEYHTFAHLSRFLPPKPELELFDGMSVSYDRLEKFMKWFAPRSNSTARIRRAKLESLNRILVPIKSTRWHASAEFQVDQMERTLLVRVTHEAPVVSSMLQQPFVDPIPTCPHLSTILADDVQKALVASPRPWEELPETLWEGPLYSCAW